MCAVGGLSQIKRSMKPCKNETVSFQWEGDRVGLLGTPRILVGAAYTWEVTSVTSWPWESLVQCCGTAPSPGCGHVTCRLRAWFSPQELFSGGEKLRSSGNAHAELWWCFSWSMMKWEKQGQCNEFSAKPTFIQSEGKFLIFTLEFPS